MTANSLPTCGFIGLGSQGAPMARRIIDAGFPTILWARRPVSLEPYRDTVAQFARSVEDVGAACDVVGLCVVNDDDVREMAGRLLPAMRTGSTLLIHSTVHPDTCRSVAATAAETGVRVLDAPVSGGAPAAEAGELTVMVGGDEQVLAEVRPVLDSFAGLIVRLGEVGSGQLVKLINNSLLVANLGMADAALQAGAALGIERQSLVTLLKASSGRSFALDVRARMETPTGFRHGSALLRKDLRLLAEVLGPDDTAASRLEAAAEGFLAAAASKPEAAQA